MCICLCAYTYIYLMLTVKLLDWFFLNMSLILQDKYHLHSKKVNNSSFWSNQIKVLVSIWWWHSSTFFLFKYLINNKFKVVFYNWTNLSCSVQCLIINKMPSCLQFWRHIYIACLYKYIHIWRVFFYLCSENI